MNKRKMNISVFDYIVWSFGSVVMVEFVYIYSGLVDRFTHLSIFCYNHGRGSPQERGVI